jgi:hypothetical protein
MLQHREQPLRACLAKSTSWIAAPLELYPQARPIFADPRERPSEVAHLQPPLGYKPNVPSCIL